MHGRLYYAITPLALALVLLGGCARPSDRLTIKGSDTLLALGQLWAEEYMKAHPEAIVSVTGGGSGTGITALLQGACDIAEASRKIEPQELEEARKAGLKIKEIVVAWDGIAVIVNPANPVDRFTLEQLSDMYQGKIKNWSELGGPDKPIVLLARETSSGTHVFFKECVLQLEGERPDADYTTSAVLSTSNQAIHDEVASNPNAIGYVGLAYVDDKVKVAAVARDEHSPYAKPTLETIASHQYPIARPLFHYTTEPLSQPVRKFLDFVLGPEGQRIVKEVGFIPVPGHPSLDDTEAKPGETSAQASAEDKKQDLRGRPATAQAGAKSEAGAGQEAPARGKSG